MIRGPTEYVPPVEVEVVMKRKAIPLDDNEGIYVRDCKTGKVRAVCGKTYMLSHNEELWEKDLPPTVEELLAVCLLHHPCINMADDLFRAPRTPLVSAVTAAARLWPPRPATRPVSSSSACPTMPPFRSTTTRRRRRALSLAPSL